MIRVRALAPFAGGGVVWRPARGGEVLTVVAKATFELVPELSRVVEVPEPVLPTDVPHDGGPEASPRAPGDLAPFKPRADVLLVGHAYAPPGEPARSLVARLLVGEVDKSIEVWADRLIAPDGELVDGPRFEKMPLRYERAAGGRGTSNPVGVASDDADSRGRRRLPNLLPPGVEATAPDASLAPVGFGPLAPSWWPREQRAGGRWSAWWPDALGAAPLPPDLDPLFFNAAPSDQQVTEIRDNERIVLEHLHPRHPRLVTSLPGLRPRAFVDAPGGAYEVRLVCDTLWIDTDRGIATVVFRGQVPLGAESEGEVVLAPEWANRPTSWSEVSKQLAELADRGVESSTLDGVRPGVAIEASAGLPFAAEDAFATLAVAAAPTPGAAPSWLARTPEAPARVPAWGPARVDEAPVPTHAIALEGAAAASNAAAAVEAASATRATPAEPARAGATRNPRQGCLDLLGYDEVSMPRLRAHPAFAEVLRREDDEEDGWHAPDGLAERRRVILDRRDVSRILARAPAADADAVIRIAAEAVDADGCFEPPLVAVAGELELTFDEVETLRALVSAAAPLVGTDKKLKELIDLALETLGTTWKCTPRTAEGLVDRIRAAFGREPRAVTLDYLDTTTVELLLEQRKLRRRPVLGAPHLRALLVLDGATEPMVAYLPEALGATLPLFHRLRAALLAEIVPAQDQREPSALAFRVLGLARRLPLPGPASRRAR